MATNQKKINFPKIKVKVTATKGDEVFISSPDDLPDMLRMLFNADTIEWTEEFLVVCLNRAHKVLGYYKVGAGGFSNVVCDPKVVLTVALQSAASSIILAHNHPSGNTMPSDSDILVTEKVRKACSYLDINLLDHFIITSDSHYSFMERGKL
jgi:DNA repair protein RadC